MRSTRCQGTGCGSWSRLSPRTYSETRYGRPLHLAHAVDGDDVGVLQPRDGARLDEEALAQRRRGLAARAMNFTATGRSSSVSCAR